MIGLCFVSDLFYLLIMSAIAHFVPTGTFGMYIRTC